MAPGSICWIQFKPYCGENSLPDFFESTIVANCCTDLNQLSATVLVDEGILLYWVPARET